MSKVKYFFFALLFLPLLLLPIHAEAHEDNVTIVDDAGLLSPWAENDLETYLTSLDSSINYLVVTSKIEDFKNSDLLLEDYYLSYFSGTSDGVAFIIDMSKREIYLQGYGSIRFKLTSGDCLDITDNTYRYASQGDYHKCIYNTMVQANAVINNSFVVRPMRIIVSLLIALILSFMSCFMWAIKDRKHLRIAGLSDSILAPNMAITTNTIITKRSQVSRSSDSSSGGSSRGGCGGCGGGGSSRSSHSGGGHSF